MINIKQTEIPGVLLIESKKFADERGYFMEGYKESDFESLGLKFKQDNVSFSKKGVLRGLHYQLPPKAQGKLVRVLQGKIWDVAVDIRKKSPTYKKWVAAELSEENSLALYLPEGFAHGFVTLSEEALVLYKTTEEYHQQSERGIIWNDPELNIAWPVLNPIVSERDKSLEFLKNARIF
jgi:dTDP-4-dehydrorhamnose 3,5-epimerase